MAAGGNDGPLELFQYNWNQVSIVKQERDTTIKDWQKFHQKSFTVPAKTLGTMMLENDDTWIDILKIDIEGSEYMWAMLNVGSDISLRAVIFMLCNYIFI